MSNSLAHQERRRARARLKAKANRRSRYWLRGNWQPERGRDEFGRFVEKMTNHQRCLWMRTCIPGKGPLGKKERDVARLAAFVAGAC